MSFFRRILEAGGTGGDAAGGAAGGGAGGPAGGAGGGAAADRQRIAKLRGAGVDLDAPLAIEHVLTLPDERSARHVVAKLASSGAVVNLTPSMLGRSWAVRATLTMVVTPDRMAAMREQLSAFATDNGGTYDGWTATGR